MKLILLALLAFGPAQVDDEAGGAPWLGVMLNDKAGEVGIEGVYGGSPAEAAGIQTGDVIRKVNGVDIIKSAELIKAVKATHVGGTIKLHVASKGGGKDVTVKLAQMPDFRELQKTHLLGKMAPDFAFKKAAGVYVPNLSALKGQVVVLDFWATWCMPCMQALPHMQELHERLGKKGLHVIGVTSEKWDTVGQVVKKRGVTYGQVSDEDNQIGFRYLVTALPTLVVIGRDGKVVHVGVGDLDAADRAIHQLLQ